MMRQKTIHISTAAAPRHHAVHAQKHLFTHAFIAFVAAGFLGLLPASAFAGGAGSSDPLTLSLCTVIGWFTGDLGRAIATLGVVVLAVGAMMGKVSWGMALTVTAGISIMLSGEAVVAKLTGLSGAGCPAETIGGSAYALSETLCSLAGVAGSATGRALATLAVCFVGIAALFGKISPPTVLLVVTGIGMIINADAVVANALSPDNLGGEACSPVTL